MKLRRNINLLNETVSGIYLLQHEGVYTVFLDVASICHTMEEMCGDSAPFS